MTAVSHGINGGFGKLSNNSCKFISFLETSGWVFEWWFSEKNKYYFRYIKYLYLGKEVTELNGKVQFSSKVHFFGELELNLVHFLANWTWTELSSLFGWTWTKNEL